MWVRVPPPALLKIPAKLGIYSTMQAGGQPIEHSCRSRTPEAGEPGRKVAEEERRDNKRDEPIASNFDRLRQGPAI